MKGRAWLDRPYVWSFLGAAAVWLVTLVVARGQGGLQVLQAALSFGSFTVVVALGQMLVITAGPGNVDLSVGSTIALGSAVSMLVMDERAGLIVPGLAAAIGVGLLVGAGNYGLIRLVRLPPIIATLSSSLVVMSVAITVGRGLRIKPPSALFDLISARVVGIPLIALFSVALALLVGVIVERTIYGRSLAALGQQPRAAHLAGVRVERTRLVTYLASGALAGLDGALIAGFSGGSSLDQGEEYLLLTIAVVIIGGTSVSGGRASVPGIWGASLFMFLLVAMLNAAGAGAGLRMLLTGVIIIAVIALAGGER